MSHVCAGKPAGEGQSLFILELMQLYVLVLPSRLRAAIEHPAFCRTCIAVVSFVKKGRSLFRSFSAFAS